MRPRNCGRLQATTEACMRFRILTAVLALGMAACTTGPQGTHVTAAAAAPAPKVTREALAAFQPGTTTVEQVLKALGSPMSDIVNADGNRTLAYSYVPVTPHWIAYFPIISAFSTDN